MNPSAPIAPTLPCPRVRDLISRLYADTVRVDPQIRQAALERGIDEEHEADFYSAMRDAYMPVTPAFGQLLYALVRSTRARTVVEYGTSFGISTLFLASGLRDNGGGQLISTEFEPSKAELARRHLASAGLDDLVEIRVGDARHTLRSKLPKRIDMLLLDGAKSTYLEILRMMESRLAAGSLVASDNSEMAGAQAYLQYVRDPANGYAASALATLALGRHHGHEIVLRL